MAASVAQPPFARPTGSLSASADLATSLSTAGFHLPWLDRGTSTYPLIAPPGRGCYDHGPKLATASADGAAGRRAAAYGFAGLFSPVLSTDVGAARKDAASCSSWGRLENILAQAVEATPAGKATAAAGAHKMHREAVGVQAALYVRFHTPILLENACIDIRVGSVERRTQTAELTKEDIIRIDAVNASRFLDVEVFSTKDGKTTSLGKAVVSIRDLPRGQWQRRHLRLHGGGFAELAFDVCIDQPQETQGVTSTSRSSLHDLAEASKVTGSMRRLNSDISLPADWSDVEDEAELQRADEDDWASCAAPSQACTSARSGNRQRNTFSVPDDLFGDAKLEIGDPAVGPAYTWQRALDDRSSNKAVPWPSSAGQLACLEESLRVSSLRNFRAARAGGDDSEDALREAGDAALSAALAAEKAKKKTAQEELQKLLRQLQEHELAAPKATAPAARAVQKQARSASPKQKPMQDLGAGLTAASTRPQPDAGIAASSLAASTPAPSEPVPFAFSKSMPVPPQKTDMTSTPASPPTPAQAATTSAQAPPAASAATASTTSRLETKTDPVAAPYKAQHAKALAHLEQVEKYVDQCKKDPASKDFRQQTKKIMNTKVGQISATWGRIQECTTGLLSALEGFTKDSDPARQQFAEHAMALRIADDAEVSVRSQPRAAWSIAQVAARVFEKFPAIHEIFTGIMCRNCPYLQPDYSGSQVGRATLASGQRSNEAFTEFADRMVSYHRLWLAVVVTQGDLGAVWYWFARTLNEPACSISAPMVHAALDAVGHDAQARYGKQFTKLVEYIEQNFTPELEALQAKVRGEEADRLRASQARLRCWLESFRREGRAKPPEGRFVETREEAELNPNI
eukprot:TRINITY_DN105837_c0_g1_i1.p1 TRINITY_DN105837_c0_g1~~TRINITY_DN105837_c0_g1_i1.p1  ORF type:complete len:859 (+),score=174.82 TRINITY_DN105837_c0_g1_i1:34-2610(+)